MMIQNKLASNFCKIYHLDQEAEEALYEIIIENMNSTSFNDNYGDHANKDIAPIAEAKENDEQTSFNKNSSKGRSKVSDNSKMNSFKGSKSNSKISMTGPKGNYSSYLPEQREEIINSFNKYTDGGQNRSDFYNREGFEDQQMMDGEDILNSPDSSIKMPHQSVRDDEDMSGKHYRFAQDRYQQNPTQSNISSGILSSQVKYSDRRNLESVQEVNEYDSRQYYNGDYSSQMEDFGTPSKIHKLEIEGGDMESRSKESQDTEIVVAEVEDSEELRYCKLLFFSFNVIMIWI